MVDTPMVAKLDQESLLAVYPGALPDISPPVSAGSLESISSGHDSPPIFTGDITNVMPFVSFSTPVSEYLSIGICYHKVPIIIALSPVASDSFSHLPPVEKVRGLRQNGKGRCL